MNHWKIVAPVALVALSLVPAPAHAQRGGGGRSPGGGGGRSAGGGGASRSPRSGGVYRGPGGGGVYRNPGSGGAYRAVPRSYGSRVVVGAPYGRAYYSQPYYAFRPRVSVGFGLYVGYPVAFPYYGIGFSYGYGYGYPYPYRYGYGYPYPYASYPNPYPYPYSGVAPYAYPSSSTTYPYPDYRPSANQSSYPYPNNPPQAQSAQGSIELEPGRPQTPGTSQRNSGGISFDITPSTAQVYVEGQYVGLVRDFSPTSQPLTLSPGRHHVEIRLVGYQTMTFDTEVTAGQVVPYQGTMQR
jgi:hypothetical protein